MQTNSNIIKQQKPIRSKPDNDERTRNKNKQKRERETLLREPRNEKRFFAFA